MNAGSDTDLCGKESRMRCLVKLVLAAMLALAGFGCERSMPVSLTHDSVLAKAGLKTYWRLKLELLEDERVEKLMLLDETLYCLTNTNHLLAVDAARGVRKWSRKVAEPGVRVYRPCHGSGVAMRKDLPGLVDILTPPAPESLSTFDLVLINTPNYALALDRATGELRRKIDFRTPPDEFTANTGGSCDGTYFYVGAVGGRCYAFRLSDGVIAWILRTGDVLTAAPRTHSPGGEPRVFVAGEDGELYVAKAGTDLSLVWPPVGIRQWPAMAGPVTADFHVDDRACFVPCVNRRVYAFSLAGGEALWRFTCGGALADPIQVSENSVFQYARGDKLYVLNPASGKVRWTMNSGRRVLAAMSKGDVPLAYLVDDARSLLVVDEILGKVRASIPLTGVELFADNTKAPALYLASRDGKLYCLRQIGSGHLSAETLKTGKPKPKPKPAKSAST